MASGVTKYRIYTRKENTTSNIDDEDLWVGNIPQDGNSKITSGYTLGDRYSYVEFDSWDELVAAATAEEPPAVSFEPSSLNVIGNGTAFTVQVQSNCQWRIEEPEVDWLVPSSLSGDGNTEIEFTAFHNETGQQRQAFITAVTLTENVGSGVLSVVQSAGVPGRYFVAFPRNITFEEEDGEEKSVGITASTEVSWKSQVDESCDWLEIVGPTTGRGRGNVEIRPTSLNSTNSNRTGTFYISGSTGVKYDIHVTQVPTAVLPYIRWDDREGVFNAFNNTYDGSRVIIRLSYKMIYANPIVSFMPLTDSAVTLYAVCNTGLTSGWVEVSCAPNEDTEPSIRNRGTITIRTNRTAGREGYVEDTIELKQFGGQTPEFTLNGSTGDYIKNIYTTGACEEYISYAGSCVDLANPEYTIVTPGNIEEIRFEPYGGYKVYVRLRENTSGDEVQNQFRVTVKTVYGRTITHYIVLLQRQGVPPNENPNP